MKLFKYTSAFLFTLTAIQLNAFTGTESSGGDPATFTMPTEDFAYSCAIRISGQSNPSATFVFAEKTVTFKKTDFTVHGGKGGVPVSSATVDFVSQADGWELSNISAAKIAELPKFLQGQRITLLLQPGANAGVSKARNVVQVIIDAKLPNSDTVQSYSKSENFQHFQSVYANVEFRPHDQRFFISASAECLRAK